MELKGKHVAVLAEDLYEDLELWYPVTPDATAEKVNAADFDAVIIPGGYAPDRMRRHKAMVDLVTSRKPEDLPAFCRTILQAMTGVKA